MKYNATPHELDAIGVSSPWWMYAAARWLAHQINRYMWHVEVQGRFNVPATGPVIIAPVHRSFIDFFIASEVTNRPVAFMAKDELWKYRLPAKFLEVFGAFPVNRSGVDRKALERAESVLESGGMLILFPEGTRRSGDTVGKLHEGAAFLAARTGAVVVPIALSETERIMPKGSKIPKRMPVKIAVGRAVRVSNTPSSRRIRRSELSKMTAEIGESMQDAFDAVRK
jgi:1-acyl-sn-glycerol-3-phosphate acyltransferase